MKCGFPQREMVRPRVNSGINNRGSGLVVQHFDGARRVGVKLYGRGASTGNLINRGNILLVLA